jgi:hypothetical protein
LRERKFSNEARDSGCDDRVFQIEVVSRTLKERDNRAAARCVVDCVQRDDDPPWRESAQSRTATPRQLDTAATQQLRVGAVAMIDLDQIFRITETPRIRR